jgi:hypothetical protein
LFGKRSILPSRAGCPQTRTFLDSRVNYTGGQLKKLIFCFRIADVSDRARDAAAQRPVAGL